MRLLSRNNDVIDGSNNFEKLQSLSNFPVFMGTVNHHSSEDKMTNMDWYISKTTGMIQLKELIPLEILYSETHTSGEIGKIWDDHHNAFCKFLLKVDHKNKLESMKISIEKLDSEIGSALQNMTIIESNKNQ